MKAVVRDEYGSPDVLRLEEIPTPSPGDDEVLVRVHAASVHKGDWEILRGEPLWVRLVGFGLLRPKVRVLGYGVAGRIEAVGRNVTQLRVGDEVFGDTLGDGLGAFAEYLCVPQSAALIRKPASLTFEQAAALPEGGFIALQALRDKGQLQAKQKLLINGGGGGAGTFAIQLANSLGAEVTGVDRTEKLELMRELGARHVIDYTQEDPTKSERGYDLIVDLVGTGSIAAWKHALARTGTYLAVGGSVPYIAKTVLLGAWISKTSGKSLGMLAVRPNKDDLHCIADLVEAGNVAPIIDRRYPLAEVAEAIRYLGEGHSKGKLIITP